MCGKDTLTTLVSMTSIKVGTMTVSATTHLFTAGCLGESVIGSRSFGLGHQDRAASVSAVDGHQEGGSHA